MSLVYLGLGVPEFIILLLLCAWFLLLIFSGWMIFVKAGYPGWKVLVPFLNLYLMFLIINEPPWWGLFFVVVAFFGDIGQLVITIFSIGMHYSLARIFGKSKLFSVLTSLFPYVFIPIIALGGSVYQGGDYEDINTEDITNLSNLDEPDNSDS